MVQFVSKGQKQAGEPPKVKRTQESLFEPEYNQPRVSNPIDASEGRVPAYVRERGEPPLPCFKPGGRCYKDSMCMRGRCYHQKGGASQDRAKAKTAARKAVGQAVQHATNTDYADPYAHSGVGTGAGKKASTKVSFTCHHTHPAYPVAEGFTVLGGSGISPFHTDCDIYVSFDKATYPGTRSLPWEAGEDFIFYIKNYGVPDDPAAFRKMVEWLAEQIKAGKKVHLGCMAGHGRTGMVLAALRMHMAGDKDAITHVRTNYCDQAMETDGQIKWLMTHWGVNVAPPRKKKYAESATTASKVGAIKNGVWDDHTPASKAGNEWFDDPYDDPFGFDSANAGRFDAPPLPDLNARTKDQTSWVANSPWQKEAEPVQLAATPETPPADLGDTPWYEEDGDV
mgnify:CR=1 FL=1